MEPEEDDCNFYEIGCKASNAFGDLVNDAIDNLADKIVEAMGKAISSLATFWVNVDTPSLTTGGGNPSAPVAFVQGSLSWYVAAAAVVAVLIGGARMAYERRAEPGRDLLRAMLTLVLVSGASLTGIGLAVTAADGFAEWIIGRSTDDFGAGLGRMISLGATTGTTGASVSAILLIILGLGGLLASLVQIVLLVVRGGFLIVLAGVLPLSASFTNTETGRAWFQKALSWTVAFILYKPAAAIIYATAFQLIGTTGEDQVTSALTGVTLMIMSLVALPALLKFVAPMVGAATGGGGGGGGAALAASVASGAVSARMVKGGASTGAGGGSGAPGPSGSTTAGP
jgi:type IV secretion system protein TrbL